MENKHLKGLDSDLNHQIKETKKLGGPSNALRRVKRRPENKSWRLNALHNHSVSMGKCDKCEASATIRSVVNGEVEYQLCNNCFLKR